LSATNNPHALEEMGEGHFRSEFNVGSLWQNAEGHREKIQSLFALDLDQHKSNVTLI